MRIKMEKPSWRALVAAVLIAFAAASLQTPDAFAQAAAKPAGPKTFASPQQGVDALIAAMRGNDRAALAALIGPGHNRLLDSGDKAQDARGAARFVAEYDAKHAIAMDGDAKAVLLVGPEDWPMPIPLVKKPQGWQFDAGAGSSEILARRIGRNELDAIQVCLAFIDMQRDYASQDRDGDGLPEYTQRFFSSPGKRDGLYWPTKEGEPRSPGGSGFAVASAQRDAKAKAGGAPAPFHGYFYRILTSQGKHARGGALNYIVQGNMIGGAALLAYPARYLASGIQSFVCNTDGVVYQKDLGADTAALAAKITSFDPDPSWTKLP